MLDDVRRIDRDSLEPADSWFNLYVARPPAAAVVYPLPGTPPRPTR